MFCNIVNYKYTEQIQDLIIFSTICFYINVQVYLNIYIVNGTLMFQRHTICLFWFKEAGWSTEDS